MPHGCGGVIRRMRCELDASSSTLQLHFSRPLHCCPARALQFSVWEPHNEDRSEAAETESARRKFVLLDVDSDNYLTAEVGWA